MARRAPVLGMLLALGWAGLAGASAVAGEKALLPPEAMTLRGVPTIPAELAADLASYANYRTAGFASWHPTRREMLIVTRFESVPQIHHVSHPGGARTQLTYFAEPVGSVDYQPGSGGLIAYTRDTGGDEFSQIYLLDPKTGKSRLLTDGRSKNSGVRWSRRGDRIAYTSTHRTGKDFDLYLQPITDQAAATMVFQAEGGRSFSVADWSPDDSALLVGDYASITNSQLWLVSLASGDRTLLTPALPGGQERAVGAARFAADGQGVYFTTDAGTDFQTLRYLDLATMQTTAVAAEKGDIEALAVHPGGKLLAYAFNDAGNSTLRVRDLEKGVMLQLPDLPQGTLGGLEWRPGSDELGFTLNTTRGINAYSLDLTAGLVQWTFSELGGLDPDQLREPELVRWPSFDGREISGFLYPPAARFAGKRPVIISIHGGPEGQSRPGFQGSRNYFLNELGVALLYPNVRGSVGFGKEFVTLDNGRKREDSVRDIGALLDYIATRPDLDAERVLVYGGSYGGYMVLASMVHYNDRIRCAVDVVGISNFVTFLTNTQDYRRTLRRVEYGDESDPAMREFLLSISPQTQAHKITKPLLVIQGKNDPRVPASESVQMVETIHNQGGKVWYVEAADEGHGFRKKPNRDFQFAVEAVFVQQHLLP